MRILLSHCPDFAFLFSFAMATVSVVVRVRPRADQINLGTYISTLDADASFSLPPITSSTRSAPKPIRVEGDWVSINKLSLNCGPIITGSSQQRCLTVLQPPTLRDRSSQNSTIVAYGQTGSGKVRSDVAAANLTP